MCYEYHCACTCGSEVRDIHKKVNRKATSPGGGDEYECPWEAAIDPATKRV